MIKKLKQNIRNISCGLLATLALGCSDALEEPPQLPDFSDIGMVIFHPGCYSTYYGDINRDGTYDFVKRGEVYLRYDSSVFAKQFPDWNLSYATPMSKSEIEAIHLLDSAQKNLAYQQSLSDYNTR